MHVLSAEEVAEWLKWFEKPGIGSDYPHADKDGIFLTHPEASCIELEYPQKLEQLPFFARRVATIGYEEQHFDGALIWFTEWGVWNSREESIGYRIIEKINTGAGQPKSFEVASGHQFRADELLDAVGMLVQPMVFAWDCFCLPTWSYGTGEFFLFISHDSFVTVVTRTKEIYDRVFALLKDLNLNPKPGAEHHVRRFCKVP
jgi:hypothetical protein